MALMVGAAWAWQTAKKRSEQYSRWAFYAVISIAIIVFLIR
jgi:hypothetical protein